MGEKRNLKNGRLMIIAILIANIIYSADMIFNILKGKVGVFERLGIYGDVILEMSSACIIILLVICVTAPRSFNSEERRKEANTKLIPFYLMNGAFLLYIPISYVSFHNMDLLKSSVLMCIYSIGVTYISRGIMTMKLSESQMNWKKQWDEDFSEDKVESKFYWRFKLWFSPHEETRFFIRCRRISTYAICLILLFCILYERVDNIVGIEYITIYPILISILLFFIECLFGIETSLTGVCTGIIAGGTEFNYTRFTVYVTDFNNKREIKFSVKANYLPITEGEVITVVHGVFSKRVIYVKGHNLDII